jgi:Icc-related predicted phosphoesterase
MRAWVFSDLHWPNLEELRLVVPSADVCIVAGDVCEWSARAISWLADHVRPFMRVVYVLGNHEYYRSSLTGELAAARLLAEARGIDLLERDSVTIGDVRFLGTTLWTDYLVDTSGSEIERTANMNAARNGLADHHLIYLSDASDRLFDPIDAYARHASAVRWLKQELANPSDGKTVVVSHHAPHLGSIAQQWRGHRLSPAFVSDLSGVIQRWQPALWVHGHTHTNFDYRVGATRIICNPRGYQSENEAAFRWDLMVDI